MNMNEETKKEILSKIKKDDKCFVYDGIWSSCYNILESKDNVITLDLSNMSQEDVQAKEKYNLEDYTIKVDDCTNKIESVQYGIEFFKNNKKIIAIEVY